MKRTSSVSRRALALLAVLGVVATVAPPPAFAADATQPPPRPLAASITRAAHTIALSPTATTQSVAKDDQAKPGDELAGSSAFFTRPLGIAVLGILALGAGYAIYSTSHDRIHSQVRQGQ